MGNIETARVSTALNREVFNFGFSGNCHFDTAVAQFLVQIEAPSAVIVDCMWNEAGPGITAAATAFVQYLRAHGLPAATPVVLAEGLPFGRNWAVPAAAAAQTADNAALRAAFAALRAAGDAALYYVDTAALFSNASETDSATAAGLHATDAGMHDMAAAFIEMLPSILAQ